MLRILGSSKKFMFYSIFLRVIIVRPKMKSWVL